VLCVTLLLLPAHQVDAHLSYDAKACYDKAMHLMDMYAARGECTPKPCGFHAILKMQTLEFECP
jgi:hypothetical protein